MSCWVLVPVRAIRQASSLCQLGVTRPLFRPIETQPSETGPGEVARTTQAVDLLKFSLVTSEAMGSEVSDQGSPHLMDLHLPCQAWFEPGNSRAELTPTFGGTSGRNSGSSEPSSGKSRVASRKESFKIMQRIFAVTESIVQRLVSA